MMNYISLKREDLFVQQHSNKADLCFLDKDLKKQQQIEEYIDNFLQNCFLFAQNQQSYVEQILKALSQLAIVQYLEIGRRCFQMVLEIVRSGTGMAVIARNIIQKYSIPLLQQQKELEYVPTFFMEGILKTVEQRDNEEMVPLKLAQLNFVDWLDQIMANYMKDMDNLREEQQQRDVLFLILWHNQQNSQNLQMNIIMEGLYQRVQFYSNYQWILIQMNNIQICTKEVLDSRQTACNFIKDVEDELRKYLFMFKKFRNSLLNPETKENKDTILLRYEKVGILIQVFGIIWKSDVIVQQQIKESFLVNELLQMATIPAIYPYLINAVVIYIRKLLKNKDIKIQQPGVDNNEIVKYICLKTHNCELLLHYLGGDYFSLLNTKIYMKYLEILLNYINFFLRMLLDILVLFLIFVWKQGAGKTESVVANILMIFTKILVGEKSSSREDFVTVFSQNATLYALDILERNQERDLFELGDDNAEYQEKDELSFGTNNFLKSLHCEPLLQENLKGQYQAQYMKNAPLNEDSLFTPETLDIDVQRSFIGKQSSYLISVLFSRDALLSYKKQRIQKLDLKMKLKIQVKSKIQVYMISKEILKNWRKIALERRAKQTEIWDAMKTSADPFIVIENQEDSIYHQSQHQLFYDQVESINLLGFLVGRNQSAKSLSLKEYFLETFGDQLNFERMLNSINFYIREYVHKYFDNLNKQQEIKKLSTSRMNEKLTTIFQDYLCLQIHKEDQLNRNHILIQIRLFIFQCLQRKHQVQLKNILLIQVLNLKKLLLLYVHI
ncbi:unnamed protein product [Paramecium primaurelia]|uniref:Uncharacterized protein n=1 Tax=Paramecium primaurelia TaxID=5886 RepID=A0A8S1MW85_PARPR|nr:unnamed protein product [Paramecium primaurelia]